MTLILKNLTPRAIALLRNSVSKLGIEDSDAILIQTKLLEAILFGSMTKEELEEYRKHLS